MSAAASINRSLTTLRTELEFLKDSNVITPALYAQITESLPDRYNDGMAPADVRSQATGQSVAPAPVSAPAQEELAEALYDYKPAQAEDLELHAGEKVKVLEKVSPNWWRGSVGSKTGMFPSNYVRLLSGGNSYAQVPAQTAPQGQMYVPPAYPQGQQQQMPFPPPSTNYYQQQPVQEQPQQGGNNMKKQHPHLSKFGSKLGNAAIFGAGATIGSDIINSIF